MNTPKDFSVCIIGAGVSGICMGKKLNDVGINYIILEKAPRLGGTWWYNIYPGVACDVPSHLYSFSFFQNPNWSKEYSPGKEILNYLEQVFNHAKLVIIELTLSLLGHPMCYVVVPPTFLAGNQIYEL